MREATGEKDTVVAEVGDRLRALRRHHGLTLGDVEERSGGRWRTSTIGAYERGIRTPSLSVLGGLAAFYEVSLSSLVGEPADAPATCPGRIVIDLRTAAAADLQRPVLRLLHHIAQQRGEPIGLVLSVRSSDLELLATMLGVDVSTFVEQLDASGVLGRSDQTAPPPLVAVQS